MTETAAVDDDSTDFDPFDGFNVESEVPLRDFADFGFDRFGEYVHIIPDAERRQMRLYRSISEDGNERVSTVIDGVKFKFNFEDVEKEIKHFYLTAHEARSLLTLCDLLASGREGEITVEWWEESGRPMMEDEDTGEELLIFTFTKPNGVERTIQISGVWQVPTHKMATMEGEGWGQ
jgi:hypothetical protein